jgi:hypothetical protein
MKLLVVFLNFPLCWYDASGIVSRPPPLAGGIPEASKVHQDFLILIHQKLFERDLSKTLFVGLLRLLQMPTKVSNSPPLMGGVRGGCPSPSPARACPSS